jgi:hypothetical protein
MKNGKWKMENEIESSRQILSCIDKHHTWFNKLLPEGDVQIHR